MMKKTSDKSNLIKVNAATAIAVLAMHVGIAAALVHMQGPKPVIKEPEEVKPIEIQMLSLQEAVEPPTAVQTKQNTPQVTQEQVTKVQSQPKPASKPTESVKPEPEIQPKPKPVEKNEPEPIQKVQSKSEAKVETKTAEALNNQKSTQQTSQQTIHQDVQPEVSTKPNFDANEHQRLIEQAAREQAAREQAAREQAAREQVAREQVAREQVAREQVAREQVAREQAAREQAAREQAAREQAAREQAAREQAAASNEPKSFSANQARWKRKPRLEVPPQVARKSNSGDVYLVILAVTVDKQGHVADVKVTKSSGNTVVDKAAISQVKKSKLHPFEQDKAPVVGLINLPIEYIVE
ncbi:energy transducer TonB [Psychrobacter piechaudii]|uniref:Transport protein TonB n=1 Tax=Psychrobacter piechaudii TaxID=1945521 RepID=A0A1R4GXF9_9GAMM|nr:energy transducer TonB [Psychrobacter piechaudii]SJM72841.1 transport protein TonB [Psychrobacter piechaudii]